MSTLRIARRWLRRRARALLAQTLIASMSLQLISAALPPAPPSSPLGASAASAEPLASPRYVSAAVMPNGQVGLIYANGDNGVNTAAEIRFTRYTSEHSIADSAQLSTAGPAYPQLATFRGRLIAGYVDSRSPNAGRFIVRASDDSGATWSAESYPFGSETFDGWTLAPRVVASRDGLTLYFFNATSGAVPTFRATTDSTLATWSAAAAAGDASMRTISGNNCGNSGAECYRAHAYSVMETATAGAWIYVSKSDSGFGQSGRGTQVGTLGGSWSAQVDHGGSGGLSGCCGESTATTFLDRSGNVYYLRAGTFGEYLYFKKSTDGGSTWSAPVHAYAPNVSNYVAAAPVGLYVGGYTFGEYVWYAGFGGSENTLRVVPLWTGAKAYPQTGTVRLLGSAGSDLDPGSALPYNFGDRPRALGAGTYTSSAVDLALPGRVLPLVFARTYNSADSSIAGPLGPGWTHSFEWSLSENVSLVTLKRGDGSRVKFTRNPDLSYTKEPGVSDTLIKNGDATFTLTTREQVRYEFSTAGALTRIEEPAGNRITLAYSAGTLSTITDAVGRVLTLSHDSSGRLTQIQDPSGRRVKYAYDGGGRLASIWDKLAMSSAFAQYRPEVVADAPATYWRLGESAGPTAVDERGAVNAAYSASGVTYGLTPGILDTNTAVNVNGTGHATASGSGALNITGSAVSVEAWVRGGAQGGYKYVVAKSDGNGGIGYALYTGGSGTLNFFVNTTGSNFVMATAPSNPWDGAWHHVVGTYDGSAVRLYVDGAQVASAAASGTVRDSSTRPLDIGRFQDGGYNYSGDVDEVAVYGSALSSARVSAHYNAGAGLGAPSWSYVYDGTSRHLTTVTDPDGRVVATNQYDSFGRLWKQTNGASKTTTITFGADQAFIQDPRGNTTTITYDPRDRVVERSNLVGGQTLRTLFEHDGCGNASAVIDRNGNRTDLLYDTACKGNLLTRTDPQIDPQTPRYTTTYEYDPKNNLTRLLDARGFETTHTYDPTTSVRLSTARQIAGTTYATTKWQYTDAANPGLATKAIAPRGNTTPTPDLAFATTLAYDTQGNLTSSTDADGNRTTFTYDALGRRTTMVDPDGNATGGVPNEHTWTTGYDTNDRTTTETDALGRSTLFGYDKTGNRTSVTDRNGNVTTYVFDGAARLWKTEQKPDPVGQPTKVYTTSLTRDGNGNVTQVAQDKQGAAGSVVVMTDYGYDVLDRLTSVTTHPAAGLNKTTTYALDGNGNVLIRTTPDSVTTSYTYDALSRLKTVAATGVATITNGYDQLSLRTSMVDGTGTSSYAYDGLGRLTEAVQPNGAMTYGYDGDSNRTSLTYPGSTTVAYSYSNAGRLSSLSDWAARTTAYTYTPAGLAKTATLPASLGGLVTTYGYDRAQRLTSLTNVAGATTVSGHSYTLDNEGNRTALDEVLADAPSQKANADATTTVQDHPAIALAADGAAHLLWDDARSGNADIYFARQDPLTGIWGANVKVNSDTGARAQLSPAIALDVSANAYAVWQDSRDGTNSKIDTNIYFAKRSAGTWGANVKVNDDTQGNPVQRNPRIAATGAGVATAVWVDLRANQTNIYASQLAAGGSTWAANKRVSDNTAAAKEAPDVVVGADGTAYAVWQDSRSGNPDVYFSKLLSGAGTWTANGKVSDDAGSAAQRDPRITINGAGDLIVVWLDDRTTPTQVRMSKQLAGTSVWTASSVVSDAAARPVSLALASRSDGRAELAWGDTRGASADIYLSRYDPSSGTWSTSALASDDSAAAAQSNPAIAVGATTVVAWRDDRAGNADVRARSVAGLSSSARFDMSYDGLLRLTGVSTTNPETFALDGASNVTSRSGPGATFTYDLANRLTSDGTRTYTWSDADRLTGRGLDTFSYDALDRLTGSTVAAVSRTYTYNGDGLLQSRTQGSTTTFLWDPATSPSRLLMQAGDKIVYGLGPLYAVKADGSTVTFARDGGKNVRAEIGSTGTVNASFRYRAYGETTQWSGVASPTYLGYAGQLVDPSGLYYMRARWYDAATGRFISRDPLRGTPRFPVSLNSFGYAGANPAIHGDPSGLCAIACPLLLIPALPSFSAGAVTLWTGITVLTASALALVWAATGDESPASDNVVVRGGRNTPEAWRGGAQEIDEEGKVSGVSGRTGATLEELASDLPHGQIGVSTVDAIERAGGRVIRTPTDTDPYHCDICGLTPEQGSELFNPTRPNIWR